tara:strand:+ start:49476 stop:50432 length:957 start_codon:yes stop_codon:yes gene_type:complete
MEKIKTAVIGVGYLGSFHAQKYAKLEQAELVAIVDASDKSDLAKKLKCQYFTDYHDIVDLVDAVSIATPTQSHFEVAKYFIQQGKHVLVEKPITVTVAEADELIALAKQHKCLIQVGHLERFNSAVQALSETITKPMFIESHRIAPFTPRGSDVNVVLDIMIHDIDLIQSMVKSPIKTIMASGTPLLTNEIDIANVRIQFESGCVANVTASRAGLKTERRMRIFQKDAYISLNLHEKRFTVYRKGKGSMFPGIPNIRWKKHKFDNGDAIMAEIAAFLNSIIENKPALVSGEDGREALKIAMDITHEIQQQLKVLNHDD